MNIENVLFIKAYNTNADRVVYVPLAGITSIEAVSEDTSLIYASGLSFVVNNNADAIINGFNRAYFAEKMAKISCRAQRRRIKRIKKIAKIRARRDMRDV